MCEEDPVEEVTLLVHLVGIENHPRYLLEEDPRLDLPAQVGRVDLLAQEPPLGVLGPGLDPEDEPGADQPSTDCHEEDRPQDATVADPGGAQGNQLAVGGKPTDADQDAE